MKTRTLNIAILAIVLCAMISCKEEKEVTTPVQPKTETSTNSKTTAALNPVHGAPGHRCDIPVGAPLDQAASTNLQQTNTALNPNVSPVRIQNGDTPTKNPPHGQPGHDCSKPVGADLNS